MPSYMKTRGNLRQGSGAAALTATDLTATTLTVSGASTLTGNVAAGGTLAVTGTSAHTGNATFGGTLAVTGASTLTGNVTAAGTVTCTSGSITTRGWNAVANEGVVFFGNTGNNYLYFDGSAYNFPTSPVTNLGSAVVTKSNRRSDAAFLALTDAATIAVDMAASWNFKVTLGGNRTLGTPTNSHEGQHGFIRVTQDGTGSRTLAYSAAWTFGTAGAPTLSTTAGKVDLIEYVVLDAVAPTIFAIFNKAS